MEVSGVAFRSLSCLSGTGFNPHSSKSSIYSLSAGAGARIPDDFRVLGSQDSRVSIRSGKIAGFSDHTHLQYYVSPRSDAMTKKKKEKKDSEMATIKKKLKFIKVLSKDLSMLSSWGFDVETDGGLVDEAKGKRISEAAELLLEQLKQLRAEEKEMKRKKKAEKARLKATQMRTPVESNCCDSSGDRESMEIVNILRDLTVAETKVDAPQLTISAEANSIGPSLLVQEQRKMLNYVQETCNAIEGRIEVCMGGKCKKAGAMALLEEFERRVGGEGSVVGCKCMGKCRDGPNVRVLNHSNRSLSGSVNASDAHHNNPLCIGVGLEDVGLIVANFFGEESNKDLGLMAA